jgi:hypothetical protein
MLLIVIKEQGILLESTALKLPVNQPAVAKNG